MTLLIDIGNSRIKWQESHNFSESPAAFSYQCEDLDAQLNSHLLRCGQPDQDVVVVSVAAAEVNSRLESWVSETWQVGVRFLKTELQWKTLTNGYERAETLGADRWYALIGAVSRYDPPLLVCDIGSAVTLDIVDQTGAHLGGYIIPGIDMMIRSLVSGTDIDINPDQSIRATGLIPNNTDSAISEGCLRAIAALIDSTNERVTKKNCTILTGGGAEIIASMLKSKSSVDNNLIFYGIMSAIEAPGKK